MNFRKGTLVIFLVSESLVIAMGAYAAHRSMDYPRNGAALGALVMALPFSLEFAGWFRMPVFMQVWASAAVGLHTFGLVWGLYDGTWWWDELTHTVSSSLVGAIAALALYLFDLHSLNIKVPRWAYPLMIMIFSIFIGVVWEIAEFGGDLIANTRMQYSLMDTVSDCYVNMLGGAIASLLWVVWLWRDPRGELAESAQKPLIDLFDNAFRGRRGSWRE